MRLHYMNYRFALFALLVFLAPNFASAASPTAGGFEVTGWIPYWRSATGTADVLPHLDKVTEVNPFVYTVKSDGTLVDNGNIGEDPWKSFIVAAKAKKVRVIPTVMSGSGELIHDLLSNRDKRAALEDAIVRMVNDNGFDGVDIDFEGKLAETRDYFSAFLRELYAKMGKKWVMCTIETRIPNEDRYYGVSVPASAGQFSNDLVEINKYCDRVRIMAYDQQGIDLKLKSQVEATGELHAPVADPRWVEKVVNFMSKDIAKSKMLIGVPTYGYEYVITAYAGNQYDYDILWTFNPGYAWPIAQQQGITAQRNSAGEMFFTYIPNTTTTPPISGGTSATLAAAAASAFATQNNSHTSFRMLTWPDAHSLQTKIDLAKRLGVRGISVFKWDGGQDPAMWNTLSGVAGTATSLPAQAGGGSTPSTPSTPAASITRTLGLRSTGADVKTLQRILNASADTRVAASGVGSPGRETTTFGPATLAALKKFQVKYGIAKSGQAGYGTVGPKTRAKLNELLATI